MTTVRESSPDDEARIHRMPPSAERSILRSLTYTGIATAMAKQWGDDNAAN